MPTQELSHFYLSDSLPIPLGAERGGLSGAELPTQSKPQHLPSHIVIREFRNISVNAGCQRINTIQMKFQTDQQMWSTLQNSTNWLIHIFGAAWRGRRLKTLRNPLLHSYIPSICIQQRLSDSNCSHSRCMGNKNSGKIRSYTWLTQDLILTIDIYNEVH